MLAWNQQHVSPLSLHSIDYHSTRVPKQGEGTRRMFPFIRYWPRFRLEPLRDVGLRAIGMYTMSKAGNLRVGSEQYAKPNAPSTKRQVPTSGEALRLACVCLGIPTVNLSK